MSYKLVVFIPESDSSLLDYASLQIQATQNLFPDLVIEQVNENDARLVTHFRNTNRFPAYLILKNNVRKGTLQLKLEITAFTDWVGLNLS